jgi:hypothetical protein
MHVLPSYSSVRKPSRSASFYFETRVLTKASAMPFDWGLLIGVVRGTRPMSRASARVARAV